MWLLNVRTEQLEYFSKDRELEDEYAILSHTWGDEEVNFQEMILHPRPKNIKTKAGFLKIRFACEQAIRDLLDYVWIDTCCIDKTSSAELSEAINSMYRWYADAKICYAYLIDVPAACPCLDSAPFSKAHLDQGVGWHAKFAASRWHKRGFTLQELIAPKEVRFYGCTWNYIGCKGSAPVYAGARSQRKHLRSLLSYVTKVDHLVLEDSSELSSISVARKFSWAAERRTSRVEDRAYCLMGIFQINMPLLYGEGRQAFFRLQQEIAKTSNDLSIFAWLPRYNPSARLLSKTPTHFRNAEHIVRTSSSITQGNLEISNSGIRVKAPILKKRVDSMASAWIILNCRYQDDLAGPIAIRFTFRDLLLNTPEAVLDPDEYYEASLSLSDRIRHEVIDVEECQHATMQCLLLLNDFRRRGRDSLVNKLPSFWLRPRDNANREFTIVESDPNMNWNSETGVLCFSSREAFGTYVVAQVSPQSGVRLELQFTSSSEFWRPLEDVRQGQNWAYQVNLIAFELSNPDKPSLAISLPPTEDLLSAGKLSMTNGPIVVLELESQNIMGTHVFIIRLSLVEDCGPPIPNREDDANMFPGLV